MEPILETVAREYINRYPNLKEICFLFPNKRCGVFLKKYLAGQGLHSEDMPHILTISEFTSQLARQTPAGAIEQLFVLYNCYLSLIDERTEEDESARDDNNIEITFEEFRNWGETVLTDFNTVDLYLVDPAEIFKNVKDYREITTDFLTDEQKEVMRECFGIEDFSNPYEFWKNFGENNSNLKNRFLNLWQILEPLHRNFISALNTKGYGTTGSIYRKAAENLEDKGKKIIPYKKIVVIGFNALSESERSIFKSLKAEEGDPGYDDFVDFIWDSAGPVLNDQEFSASRFVRYNRKHFPSPQWIKDILLQNDPKDYPEIEIIASPSFSAQTKIAGEILKDYNSSKKIKDIKEAKVALVLPDETLLSNLLYSIPDEIEDVNLTMGFGLKQTSVASFISLFKRLYSSMSGSGDKKNFFTRDLRMFLSHPYSYFLWDPDEIGALFNYLLSYHKMKVSIEEIADYISETALFVDIPAKNKSEKGIFDYVDQLLSELIYKIEEKNDISQNEDLAQIRVYSEYLLELKKMVETFKIKVSPQSLLNLIEKVISTRKIGFEGEPLTGLQIMGTLETRTLDFKNVIILSMNEGVMPRRALGKSFIPETLRKAYGLPPSRYAEEIFGYYFYRLISRAEKVTLIYDARAISGMKDGESRYLLQLRQFAPKEKLKEISWQFKMQSREGETIEIAKTEEIREELKKFQLNDHNRKNFSASSLNSFRECQIKFFLQNVMNINSDPERTEYPDAITIGNILHDVMMCLYLPEKLRGTLLSNPVTISKEKLKEILENPELIKRLIKEKFLKYFYGIKEEGGMIPESGVSEMVLEQVEYLVREIVNFDLSKAPFKLYGCEISENIRVKLKSGRIVNFRFAIDRLDEISIEGIPTLRIVDYKTGGRKRNAGSAEEVFGNSYPVEQIFQLFTYAWLLGKRGFEGWEQVRTEIYFVPDMVEGKDGLPKIGRDKVESFEPYAEMFEQKIEEMIESVFETPSFYDTSSPEVCSYCNFKTFCKK